MLISRQVRNGSGKVNTIVKQRSNRAIFAEVKFAGYAMSTSGGVFVPNVRYAKIPIANDASNAKAMELVDTRRQTLGVLIGCGSDS